MLMLNIAAIFIDAMLPLMPCHASQMFSMPPFRATFASAALHAFQEALSEADAIAFAFAFFRHDGFSFSRIIARRFSALFDILIFFQFSLFLRCRFAFIDTFFLHFHYFH
jgi:hypothetical protein